MNSAVATNHTYSNMNRRLTLHTIIKLSRIQKFYQFKKNKPKYMRIRFFLLKKY